MHAYTTAKYANYVHVHMYLVHELFSDELKKRKLTNNSYKLDTKIDGNIATWFFETNQKTILDIFSNIINKHNFTETEIENALKKLARKNSWKIKLKNLNELTTEVNNTIFQKEKPNLTNDSLMSPCLDFEK